MRSLRDDSAAIRQPHSSRKRRTPPPTGNTCSKHGGAHQGLMLRNFLTLGTNNHVFSLVLRARTPHYSPRASSLSPPSPPLRVSLWFAGPFASLLRGPPVAPPSLGINRPS